jgi:hypothetical protein
VTISNKLKKRARAIQKKTYWSYTQSLSAAKEKTDEEIQALVNGSVEDLIKFARPYEEKWLSK